MKTFKKFIVQINETLTPKQRKWVDRRTWGSPGRIHDELFSNPPEGSTKIDDHTFTMPVSPVDRGVEQQIRGHLEPHGYAIHDYVGDHITDRHGRKTSIGKALGKVKQDPNLYASDPRIRNRSSGEISGDTHEIMISRHPYHVAGMSSGRNWDSCMTLPGDERNDYGGQFHSKVGHDLSHGTLIAYLTKKGAAKPNTELNKDEALSRILLKKHESPSTNPIFRAEKSSYSPASRGSSREKYPQFERAVRKFGEKHWKGDDDSLYFKNDDLYNDDGEAVLSAGKHETEYSPNQLHDYASHLDKLESQYQDNYDVKDPLNLHHHRMKIAKHPNTSAKTLESLVPDDSTYYGHYNYQHYNWSPRDNPKGELLDTIANHKNVSADTLHKMLEDHLDDLNDADEISYKLAYHPDADEKHLESLSRNDDALDEIISKHKKASSSLLDDLHDAHSSSLKRFGDNGPEGRVLKNIAHHKNTSEDTHEKMLADVEDGEHDGDLSSHLLQGIARNSSNPEHLHRVALAANPNHPDHHIVQRLLTKNKNTETHTLQHIKDNLSSSYGEVAPTLIKKIDGVTNWREGRHHYHPETREWSILSKDAGGESVYSPISKSSTRKLNKLHAKEVEEINTLYDTNKRKSQERILTNVVKHKNTPLTTIQDMSSHENPVISSIAQDRLTRGRIDKLL